MTAGTERFDQDEHGFALWHKPWLVRCPRCSAMAVVRDGDGERGGGLVCGACGLRRSGGAWLEADGIVHASAGRRGRWRRDFTPRRYWPIPHTERYELWLRTTCCGGHVLWATGPEHLAYLESYVGARLREGSHVPHQRLHHKLPTWMKEAKHRDEVLRALDALRARL